MAKCSITTVAYFKLANMCLCGITSESLNPGNFQIKKVFIQSFIRPAHTQTHTHTHLLLLVRVSGLGTASALYEVTVKCAMTSDMCYVGGVKSAESFISYMVPIWI